MSLSTQQLTVAQPDLVGRYLTVGWRTESLVEQLSAEDMGVQSMAGASPAKWHLAHTGWLFETSRDALTLRERRMTRSSTSRATTST